MFPMQTYKELYLDLVDCMIWATWKMGILLLLSTCNAIHANSYGKFVDVIFEIPYSL